MGPQEQAQGLSNRPRACVPFGVHEATLPRRGFASRFPRAAGLDRAGVHSTLVRGAALEVTDELAERIPPFWDPIFSVPFAIALAAGVAIVGFGPEQALLEFSSRLLPTLSFTLDEFGVFLAASAAGAAFLRLAVRRRDPGLYQCDANRLELPGRRSRRISYEEIDALQRVSLLGRQFLSIGRRNGRSRLISSKRLADPDGIERLRARLLDGVATAGGAHRAAHVQEISRRAEGQSLGAPWFSLLFAGTLTLVFAGTGARQIVLDPGSSLVNVPGLVARGELFRTITAIWIHSGLQHLAHNAIGLLFFGWLLERLVGWRRLLLVGLAAGIAGSAAHLFTASARFVGGLGASAWLSGWIGLAFFLRALRAAELPPILRVRAPWALGAVWMALVFASIDPVSLPLHLAGLSVGVAAIPVLVPKGLLRGPARREPALAPAAAGALVCIVAAFGWAGIAAKLYGERDRLLLTQWITEQEADDAVLLNNVAWAAAIDPEASPERLAIAERSVMRSLEVDPHSPYALGTLATVLYRRGELDQAVETAWSRVRQLEDPFALEQAARFELARQRRLGPQREGAGSEGDVELEWVTGAGGPPHLRLRAKDLFAEGLAVHAVAVRNGKPAAHGRVWIGRRLEPGEVLNLAIPFEAEGAFPGAQLVVTRIEVPPGVASGEVRSEVRALGSLTAGLP